MTDSTWRSGRVMPDVLQGAGTTLRVALSAHGMCQVGGKVVPFESSAES